MPASDASLRDRVALLDLEQKVRLLTGADPWALHAEPAIGLRRIVTSDGPAGVRGEHWDEREPSANVPSPTALAATWDERRVERIGGLLAAECARKGVDVLLAPTVNLHRTPYAGRHFECFSEDPLLTARIGAAYVRGLQAGGAGATVKHFVANDSETERFSLDVRVDERALRELYLAPFEAIVRDARPWAIMAAYNGVGGHTMTESPMLTDVLKGEWGFDGVVMSDWYAGRSTEAAARAGLDLLMPGPSGPWGDALTAAVREGRVPEAAVDDKVLRLLRLAARAGALEGVEPAAPAAPAWADEDVAAELRATAAASFVLLRNEGVLPLDARRLRRVAVLGPHAARARTLGGGSATVFPPYTVAPLDGLRAALGDGVAVQHAPGVRAHTRLGVAPPELLGERGVEVRFVGADGAVLGSERRAGAAFTWPGAFTEDLMIDAVATVEVHARLRARTAGEHVVGCSGVGRFALTVAGAPAFEVELRLPQGADPVEAIMSPPQHGHPVVLETGEEADVVLRHELGASSGGSFDVDAVSFQLNVEPPRGSDEEELARAVELAASADAAVVVVGTTEEVESEGFDRDDLALPGRQDELVRRVAAANPRTVAVVNAGAPVLLPWAGDVPAVLVSWFGGQEVGNALADVLLGAAEPAGRLPVTWPASEEGLPGTRPSGGVLDYAEGLFVGHRAAGRGGAPVAHPFGHGLGYAKWEYGRIEVDSDDGRSTVRVHVRNTGEHAGHEVVQVYASRPGSAVERPEHWLAGFVGVEAAPGEEVAAELDLPHRALAHWDIRSRRFQVEPGTFVLQAGRSAGDLRLRGELRVSG